jgi:hypothetical protein
MHRIRTHRRRVVHVTGDQCRPATRGRPGLDASSGGGVFRAAANRWLVRSGSSQTCPRTVRLLVREVVAVHRFGKSYSRARIDKSRTHVKSISSGVNYYVFTRLLRRVNGIAN